MPMGIYSWQAILAVGVVGLGLSTLPGAARGQEAAPPPAVTTAVPPAPSSPASVNETPLDDMPGIGIDWPTLTDEPPEGAATTAGTNEPLATDGPPALSAPVAAESLTIADPQDDGPPDVADDGSEKRYAVEMTGLDDIADAAFHDRFDSLSLLRERKGKPANLAQINRRMQQDKDVLDRLLRAKGYYDASIRASVLPPENGGDGKLIVRFAVAPGQLYTLERVSLPGLEAAGERADALRSSFPVHMGDAVDADTIFAGRVSLATALGEGGFPFAKVDDPVVEIDHETRLGALDVPVAPGGFRTFGAITLSDPSKRLFSPRHLQRISRFKPGEMYMVSDVEDLRRAIVATGLVSSATLTPKEAGDGTHVNVDVALTPAKMRTIAGEAGYGSGEGYRAEVSWQHRNFFPPEGALTLRGLVGTKEQFAGVSYRRNNFRRRDHVLTAGLSAQHINQDAYAARTISLTGGLERQTNIIFQKKWVWSVGAELVASKERDAFGSRAVRTDRTYFIAALPTSLLYDGSDDLLNPSRGFRLGARLSPEVSFQGSTFGYARAQIDGSVYIPAGQKLVIASRLRLGSIVGSNVDRIAPSRRFYAGGGASVRGYAYQSIGPRDANNEPLGGKSLAEFSLEARVRLGNFGVVPFVDAGNISTKFLPTFGSVRYGAGLGLRYYSSFGPIRIDVGTPLNRQPGDSRIAVYVSLGQAF